MPKNCEGESKSDIFSDNKILFQTTLQKWIHFAHSKCSENSDQRLKRKLKRRCHDCVLSQESESEESFASYSLISSQPFHLPLHQIGHVELPLVPGQSHVVALNVPRLDQRRHLFLGVFDHCLRSWVLVAQWSRLKDVRDMFASVYEVSEQQDDKIDLRSIKYCSISSDSCIS